MIFLLLIMHFDKLREMIKRFPIFDENPVQELNSKYTILVYTNRKKKTMFYRTEKKISPLPNRFC